MTSLPIKISLAVVVGLLPIVVIVLLLLGLQQQDVYSTVTIPVNSTYEIDIKQGNLTAAEYERLIDAQTSAHNEVDKILFSIQTQQGIDVYENECNYSTEMNPYKVIECYEKNKDKIK